MTRSAVQQFHVNHRKHAGKRFPPPLFQPETAQAHIPRRKADRAMYNARSQ